MKKDWLPLAVLVIILIALTCYWYQFPFIVNKRLNLIEAPNATNPATPFDYTRNGTFGDSYGALNALFAVFTIAGLLYTIYLQQTQLNIQRKELRIQRQELKLQREEMAATRNEFVISRATNIVYSQIESIDKEAAKLYVRINGNLYEGTTGFSQLFDFFDLDDSLIDLHQNVRIINVVISNISSIADFCRSVEKSVQVVKGLIVNNNLNLQEIKELLNIFYLNIDSVQLAIIRIMLEQLRERYKYFEQAPSLYTYSDPNLLTFLADLNDNIIGLFDIRKNLTNENIESYKAAWRLEIGL